MVNILGKNCEVKASEPKTAEAAHYAHSTINLAHNPHQQQQQQQQYGQMSQQYGHPTNPQGTTGVGGGVGGGGGWNQIPQQPQRLVFNGAGSVQMQQGPGGVGVGVGGSGSHPLQVSQTMSVPPNFGATNNGGALIVGAENGPTPIYSHSTITRTTAGPVISPDGTTTDGAANVYIQNNFYILPPGTTTADGVVSSPLSHHATNAVVTPEALQAQQTEMIQSGVDAMSLTQTATAVAVAAAGVPGTAAATVVQQHQHQTQYTNNAYSAPSALQPSYPGPNNGVDTQIGNTPLMGGVVQQQQHQQQQVQQQQMNTMTHVAYSNTGTH